MQPHNSVLDELDALETLESLETLDNLDNLDNLVILENPINNKLKNQ